MTSPIHFFHANGFPAETYRDLLNNLEGEVESPISILGKGISSVEEGYDNFVQEVIELSSDKYFCNAYGLNGFATVSSLIPSLTSASP